MPICKVSNNLDKILIFASILESLVKIELYLNYFILYKLTCI